MNGNPTRFSAAHCYVRLLLGMLLLLFIIPLCTGCDSDSYHARIFRSITCATSIDTSTVRPDGSMRVIVYVTNHGDFPFSGTVSVEAYSGGAITDWGMVYPENVPPEETAAYEIWLTMGMLPEATAWVTDGEWEE